jgi:hypothetical protein
MLWIFDRYILDMTPILSFISLGKCSQLNFTLKCNTDLMETIRVNTNAVAWGNKANLLISLEQTSKSCISSLQILCI